MVVYMVFSKLFLEYKQGVKIIIIVRNMKQQIKKFLKLFSVNNNTDSDTVVNDASTATAVSEKEINRRIDMAAKHTVKEYGHIIERLSKE